MTKGEKGDIIKKLSDERTNGKTAGAARKGLREDRKYHEKNSKEILKKYLTRASRSDIILKLLYGAEITEKSFLKKL